MSLYEILSRRWCVNILKVLYDEEVVKRSSYTLQLGWVRAKLKTNSSLIFEIGILKNDGLINSEKVDNNFVLSITEKGKKFIEIFDALVKLMKNGLEEHLEKKPLIRYELSDFEKRILLFAFKITKEKAQPITIKELTQELYPYQEEKPKGGFVLRYLKNLIALNLLEKKREGKKFLISVTESGKRVVREQFMKAIL